MRSDNFAAACDCWSDVLGPEFVLSDSSTLRSAETATFLTTQHVLTVLRPANREQVQECLRIANQFCVPLYPVSSGKNWGYGSRVPPVDGCALLDLSRLDRILDFSEKLGYVTVEPGVTQRRLYEFLQERHSGLWMDSTGSSPECSLIGNAMERGFGHTPYGDHYSHVCGLEVVLPDGSVIETGAARFPGAATAPVNRWGLGPSLDGIFSQSNLGIVTRMTIWLMPKPDLFEAFFFRSTDPDGLPDLIDALRRLRLKDVLRSSMHIVNDYKVLGGLRQYPWTEANDTTPLTPDLMARFRQDLTFGYWNVSGGLYGTKSQFAEAKRLLRKEFAGQQGRLQFLSEEKLQLAVRFATPFKWVTGLDIRRTAKLVGPVMGLMRGEPMSSAFALSSAYWRKRSAPPSDPDPDRDGCGLLWYAPTSPADGQQVERLAKITVEIMLKHRFEPMISLTMLTPRIVYSVLAITYDRGISGEDERAMECYRELVGECQRQGYFPYRSGIQSQQDGLTTPSEYSNVLSKLKRALDPNEILAPGRYQAAESRCGRD